MGADIHVYIEHNSHEPREGEKRYWSTFGGRINPGRDYTMFGLLANVRCDGAIYEPRGLPSDIAWQTGDDAFVRVSDSPDLFDLDGYCRPASAEDWVRLGYSSWVEEGKKITHPDYHSHSWLKPEEWKNVIAHRPGVGAEYEAISAAMDTLQARGKKARVVFWFDN